MHTPQYTAAIAVKTPSRRPKSLLLASAVLTGALCLPEVSAAASQQDLESKVQALSDQLEALKAELNQLKAQQQAQPAATTAVVGGQSPPPPNGAAAANKSGTQVTPPPTAVTANANLSFFGYGELNYSRPQHDSAAATADIARFVLGVGYQFNESTRFMSELEIEHTVSSADDPGEVEVEQAYIEHSFSDRLYTKVGLFLIPTGLLNENHEPTRYHGVFRNNVETAIIPTTWREGGVALQGFTESGLRWDIGLTTGFNLAKWDATSGEGQETPLGSIHQELALARAADLSGFAAINYTGVPGLRLGASVFTGDSGQKQPGFSGNRITLWEGHARWSPGQWELSALYAHGHIDGTARINMTLLGNSTLIPEDFFGWYGEAAYRAFEGASWSLTPFVRYERFNTGSSYADLGQGITPSALRTQAAFTGGLDWVIAPGVVIKADYQDFRHSPIDSRFDLGIGYEF